MALHFGRYTEMVAAGQHPKGTYMQPATVDANSAYNATVPTERNAMRNAAIRRHIAQRGNTLRTSMSLSSHSPTVHIDDLSAICS